MNSIIRRLLPIALAVTTALQISLPVYANDPSSDGGSTPPDTSAVVISDDAEHRISGSNDGKRIVVGAGFAPTITLSGVTLGANPAGPSIELQNGSHATLVLEGSNTVLSSSGFAGIQLNEASLSIDGDGVLKTTGGSGGAGIGGGSGQSTTNITILGGDITAIGGTNAAGIGGGDGGAGSSITIQGLSIVKATGNNGGAGIGGGRYGSGTGISIGGSSKVTAESTGTDSFGTWAYAIGSSSTTANGTVIGTPANTNTLSGDCVVFATGPSTAVQNMARNRGILFENKAGNLYGTVRLSSGFTIPAGNTLAIRSGSLSSDLPISGGTIDAYVTPSSSWNLDKSVKLICHATGITLDQTEADLLVGKTLALKATVEPDNAVNKTITWRTLDKDVATVNNGTVTGVAEGETTIIASSADSGVSARFKVYVYTTLPDRTKGTFKVNYKGELVYYDAKGVRQKGWIVYEGKSYYLSTTGVVQTGWKTISNKIYWLGSDGIMATGWKTVDGKWYYFGADGAMNSNWTKVGNTWYYLGSNGVMRTGWTKVGSSWYYLDGSGAMKTGWLHLGNTWYYLNGSGAMRTGWVKVSNTWYYFNGSGYMKTGWVKLGSAWYYLSGSGAMQTGWKKLNGSWYYFTSNGSMATGVVSVNGQDNRFDSSGRWKGTAN